MRENPESRTFKMTICGIDELGDHAAASVSHVLSILDPGTPEPRAFRDYGGHERLELRFHDVIEDEPGYYQAPQPFHVQELLAFGRAMRNGDSGPRHLLVHCHMGISRSTAAATLVLAEAEPERPPADIVAEIARLRTKAWPNLRMIELGDAQLGRNGALVRAVRARHREVAAATPQVVDFMRASGRGRELD